MSTRLITEKYAAEIHGTLHCYDRVVISGNLQPLCYAKGMTKYLYTHQIRIFDYVAQFAEPLRNLIRENAQVIAQENGMEIEFIRKQGDFRKEEKVKRIFFCSATSEKESIRPASNALRSLFSRTT